MVQEQWKLQGLNKLLLKMSGVLVNDKVALRHMMCSDTRIPTHTHTHTPIYLQLFNAQFLRHYGIACAQQVHKIQATEY
jgi:hypothetical protein